MKTTYRDIINFVNSASRWTQSQQKEPPNKLTYAVARMLKRCQGPLSDYNEAVEDLRNKHCLEDEKTKAIQVEENGQYKFTKEGTEAVVKGQRALLREEIEIEPYFATALPDNLNDDVRVAFEGFVIKETGEEHAAG